MSVADSLLRILNGVRKVAAGLRPFNESVWPGVHNDLFVAHESIYRFFTRFVEGRDTLDAGCGTGYGAFILSEAGATSVTGVDVDRSSVRYAARRYRAPNLRFARGDLEKLAFPDASFEVVVSSNALEHLAEPAAFVSALRRIIRPGGTVVIAVPPIVTAADRETHADIHYHRSNLTVREWHSLLVREGVVRCYLHRAATAAVRPDFASPRATRLRVDDFAFVAVELERFYSEPAITAVFVLNVE